MESLKEYQEWVKYAWTKAPKQVNEKDEILFLIEEIGEMAEAIRKLNGNKENKNFKANLNKEFGDILLAIITLSLRYNINLDEAFMETKKSIEKRYIIDDIKKD